ncbi:diguanylate cyclase [Salinimonas sp. HHU 13199]|uniref:diguanylate cyclase n=1 Tax=Salinimonas profundi TaxID=2729140 RepID=A0ABR8LKV6_9ALTE|nr:GGDEF domain-containing protein [Salinimonas profundi]MBD3586372.1 diguanylate cyclase [Salinimonas profundi]
MKTVLGKYFYLSSFLYVENDPAFYALADSELETLRKRYPEYYYEREVLMIWLSDLPDEEKFEAFRDVQTIARQNRWVRIEGWATSMLVLSLQSSELHFNAIIEMNNFIPRARHSDKSGMTYDYTLHGIFYQMFSSLYSLNDFEGALKFCRKYKAYSPDDISVQIDGISCEISVLLRLNRLEEVQAKLKTMSKLVESADLIDSRIRLLMLSAAFYREKDRPDLLFVYAKDALDLHLKHNSSLSPTVYGLYSLLTASQLELNNAEKAEFYLNKMRAVTPTSQTTGPEADINDLTAQARILNLKGEHEKAILYYEKLLKALYFKEDAKFRFREMKGVGNSINAREVKLTKQQLKKSKDYLKIVTVIATVTTLSTITATIVLWRQSRRKRDLERFSRLDSLTRVYNRWFALDAIKKRLNDMKRQDDKVCVALIDLDHFKRINKLFGHQVGDAILSHFARLSKYQFRDEDVFGRYGGEAFVLMLSGATQSDAVAKLHKLREILSHQDLTKLGADGTLKFSAGVVEVSEKADITQVLSQCDKLLHAAKQHGRSQDICAPFRTSMQDDIL